MHWAQCFTEIPTRRRPWLLALLVSAVVVLAATLPSAATAAGWSDAAPGPLNVDRANSVTDASLADVGGTPYTAWSESTPDRTRNYVFAARYSGGAWEGVGGLIDQNGGAPQIANIAGVPYLAYSNSSGQVYVDRLHNGVWQTIGGAPLASPINDTHNQAEWTSIAGDRYGNPYVAWSENSAGYQSRVYVSAYLNGSWYSTTPGHSLNFDPHDLAGYPRIANINGTLWVTWLEHFSDGWSVEVEYYNGTAWVPAGAPQVGTVGKDADAPNIADVGGVPYMVWYDFRGGSRALHVARYDPHATPNWVPVGAAVDVIGSRSWGGESIPPGIADVNGVPWVTWTSPQTGGSAVGHVHVAEFAAGQWEQVSGPLNADPNRSAWAPTITTVGGRPYVSLDQETTDSRDIPEGAPVQLHVMVTQPEMPLGFTSVSTTRIQATTTIAIGLSRSSDVRLDFTKPAVGRKVRGACVAPTARNRHRPGCVRTVTVRTIRFHGHAGLNRLNLSATKQLRPGRYQVRITATDAPGHTRSVAVTL